MSLRLMRGACAAVVIVVSGTASVRAADTAVPSLKQAAIAKLPVQQKAALGYAKMDDTLAGIAEAAKTAPKATMTESLKAAAPAARVNLSVPSTVPTVLADITVEADTATVESQLRALGVTRLSSFANLISAWIPADRLADVAALGTVHSMRAPRASTHVGTVTSQGDYLQRSQFLRASTRLPNLTGSGVTVGVLSDSFGCTSKIKSYADDVASGDLPANVQVLSEISDCTTGTDEGRAMAQIVYDVAPQTTLKFYTAFNGEADFANGIVALAKAGAKVIVDDVSYFDEPFFQDGIVSQAVDQVRALGVAYYSSAGNSARSSYEAPFKDSGVVGPAGGMIAGEKLMNFDTTGATVATTLPITVPANSSIIVYLQWDDPYKTGGGPGGGAKNLLDICLTGPASGGLGDSNIQFCTGPVAAGSDPFQIFGGVVDTKDFSGGIVVGLASGSAPGRIKLAYSGLSVNQFATNSGTVQGHPVAKGAAAVGAMYFRANAVCLPAIYSEYTLESFSSSGGTPLLFDVTGKRLATPEIRQKPDFVAPDGGLTTFFLPNQLGARTNAIPQCANPANSYNFFGTSAAAPHAAGVAALLLQAQPKAGPDDLRRALVTTAAANTSTLVSGAGTAANPYVYANLPVPNFDVGYGLIQADAALAGVLPVASIAPAYTFGYVLVGTTDTTSLTLTNSGQFPLTLGTLTTTGDFRAAAGNCPAALAAGASCLLSVTFAPTDAFTRSGTLTVGSNAVQPDGSKAVTVALYGTGTVPPDTNGGGNFGLASLVLLAVAALRRRMIRRPV